MKKAWHILKYFLFIVFWSLYFYYLFQLERAQPMTEEQIKQGIFHYQFYSLVGVVLAFFWWVDDNWKVN